MFSSTPRRSPAPRLGFLAFLAFILLTGLVLLPSPACAGYWKFSVAYTGTGNTTQTGAGVQPGNVNQGVSQGSLTLGIDTRGRVYSASDILGSLSQFRYDKNSNVTKVLDGSGNAVVVAYGAANEPKSLTWPDGANKLSLSYDAAGRVASVTNELSAVANVLYDNADRPTDVQFPATPGQNVHVTYDSASRPLSLSDATGSSTFNYDTTLKRLTSVQTVLGGSTFTVSYTYYPDGKRKAMTSPAGTTSYSYNAAGELTSLTSPFGETTSWSYDHADRITGQTTTTAANTQLATIYTYGVSGLTGDPSTAPYYLRTIQQKINGVPFWTYTLQHSYLNQLLSQAGSGSDGTTESETYSFDLRGRLASDAEQYNGGGHNYTNSGSFGYDLANNLEGQAGAWTYNSDDQATVANSGLGGLPAATGLSYDNAGDLTGLNGMTLGYDVWGNLSSASGAFGTASYTTDSRGNRVSKTVNGTTTYYLYDGDLLIAEVNSTGQVQKAYTWGPLGVISDRINLQTTPQSRYYEFDATGSTRALLDQNGVGLSRGTYSAWGSSTGYTPGTPLAWQGETGCYTDAETGLMQMGARYYSPSLGRFTRRDPAGFVNGPNVYAYCGDDPVNLADPGGTDHEGLLRKAEGLVPGLNLFEDLKDFNDAATKFGNAYSQELYGKGSPDAVVAAIDGMKAPLGALLGDTLNTGMVPGAAYDVPAKDLQLLSRRMITKSDGGSRLSP